MNGLCECGCGQPTRLAPQSNTKLGWVKGQPIRYIVGHSSRGTGAPLPDRVDAKLDKTGECWLWTGSLNREGYGQVNKGQGRGPVLVHRYQYERYVGPIPDGLPLDHLCRVRACARPEHLEPVTAKENVLRSHSPQVFAHLAGTCTRGHDASLFYRRPDGRVAYCSECRRIKHGWRKRG